MRGGLAGGGSDGAPGSLARNAPQRPYARRQRVAIVFDSAVEEKEERRRFLLGQVKLHPLALRHAAKRLSTVGIRQEYQARVSNTVSRPVSAAIAAASSAMRINFVITRRINEGRRPNPTPW